MKKIYYLIVVVSLLLANSCEDYLNVKPRGFDIPREIAHYEGLLFGTDPTYNPIFFFMAFEYNSDKTSYGNAVTVLSPPQYKAFRWDADLFSITDRSIDWETPYKLIHIYNLVINNVMDASDGTDLEKQAIGAEARMLRAWWTFILSQNFGKPYNPSTASTDPCVPIVTKEELIGLKYERASVQEVYDFVIREMSESLPHLQERESHTFRVFKSTGYAMLGKVYWMKGEYNQALGYLETAMELSQKDTRLKLLDFNAMLTESGSISKHPQQYESSETIFFTEFDQFAFRLFLEARKGVSMFYLKNELIKKYFVADDLRLANLTGIESTHTAYKNFDEEDIYLRNFNISTINMGISFPDLYLMYAECLARDSKLDKAKEVLYEFRQYRMKAESAAIPEEVTGKEELIRFVVDERMRENFACGTSWYDTRRLWNDPLFQELKQYYTHFDGDKEHRLTEERLTLRVPPNILEWHPDYAD